MNAFELALAVFGLGLLAWAIVGTKETIGSRLFGAAVGLIALLIAGFVAVLFGDHDRGRS
jgi:hypothetical protein